MSDNSDPLKKILEVKGWGDSLYVPLTKFFKRVGIGKGDFVKVELKGRKVLIERASIN